MTRSLFAGMIVLWMGLGAAQAQSIDALTRGGPGSYYTFADPTDITIQVKVWGAVGNPGLYEVRQGLTLSTLLSLAGGPQTGVQSSASSRTLTVRLHRPRPDGTYQVLIETQMQDQILVLDQDPALLNGDVLIVEEQVKQRFNWRDGLSVLSAVGTLVLIVAQLANTN